MKRRVDACEEFLSFDGSPDVQCDLGRGHTAEHRASVFRSKIKFCDGRRVEIATVTRYRWPIAVTAGNP